jgi:hypothetical protein
MRAPSPWRTTRAPTPKKWAVRVDGKVVQEIEVLGASNAASEYFRAEAKAGRYPPRCKVGQMVFRNSLHAAAEGR